MAANAGDPRFAVASAHPLATAAGYRVFENGGNACDAAITVAAVLAVVEPYSSGLGGGGFFLLHDAASGSQVMIDAREVAPSAVRPALFFDDAGRPRAGASVRGGLAAAIPGLPAAIDHLARRCAKLPLHSTLAPAIALARDGFAVDPRYVRIAQMREKFLQEAAGAGVFLDNGRAPGPGHVLRQPDLAVTLQRIGREGAARAFYRGTVAEGMVRTVNAAGGVWQSADLEAYRVVERVPQRFRYRGATITAAALPSAGGVALAQAFGMLAHLDPGDIHETGTAHLVVEVLRRAFRDRLALGDPDHAAVPLAELLDGGRLRVEAAGIDRRRASSLAPPVSDGTGPGSGNTTHFSIIDREGNRVAATLTINLLFGSGLVAQGTGVLLNNQMDDFTLCPDLANSFRLRGGEANAMAPGKRPLSSMTPAFVEDDKGVLVLGAPGGSRIISQVLLAALEYLRHPVVDLKRLVALPRYHHQYWPDRVEIEPEGFSAEWRAAMERMGHRLHVVNRRWGNMQAVFQPRGDGAAQAASDPRGGDVAWY
ncbi:MAG: gamma-glutamyltransferase [Burkholderiales bacterium]|nr:gamma-glutamyltransferase [Burkholderiales bacterium]